MFKPHPKEAAESKSSHKADTTPDPSSLTQPFDSSSGTIQRDSLAAPDTPPGEPITAHSVLTLQQTRGNKYVLRALAAQSHSQNSRRPSIQRAWSDAPTTGAVTNATSGPAATATPVAAPANGWNSGENAVGTMRRIPIEGLAEGNQNAANNAAAANQSATGRAIVIIPAGLTIPAPPAPVPQIEVFLHLHGHNVGYRQRTRPGDVRGSEVGTVRDVDLDRIEQQLQTVDALPNRQVIGVLPQGTVGSGFGTFNSDAYLTEVFAKLNTLGVWGNGVQGPTSAARVILSGHSGAGNPIASLLNSGAGSHSRLPANLREVILFDAINDDSGAQRDLDDPTAPRHADGFEIAAVNNWITASLNADQHQLTRIRNEGLAASHVAATIEADQLAYLQTSMRFRGYHTNSDYARRYDYIDAAIQRWLSAHARTLGGSGSAVFNQLKSNYVVEPAVPRQHDRIVGGGGVEDSLRALPPLPAPAPAAVPAPTAPVTPPPAAPPATLAPITDAGVSDVPDAGVRDADAPIAGVPDTPPVARFFSPSPSSPSRGRVSRQTPPAAPAGTAAPASVAAPAIPAAVQTAWDAAPRGGHGFFHGVADFADMLPLYQAAGIADPFHYLLTNITRITFFSHVTQGHRDLQAPLTRAEAALTALSITPAITSFGSFNARAIRGRAASLSKHAAGRAIDINADNNPLQRDPQIFHVIQAVTGVNLSASPLPALHEMRTASDQFRQLFTADWVQQQRQHLTELRAITPPTPESRQQIRAQQQLIREISGHRGDLNQLARTGFLNLEESLVDALRTAGLNWGGDWATTKDFMHFELGGW